MHSSKEHWQQQQQWSEEKQYSSDSQGKGSGRKGRLDHNILSYYRESLRHLEEAKASGSDSEDAELLLDTVFDSLSREGRQLSQNQTGSRLAESLVALADWRRLARLLANWSENWSAVVEDRFAHRVLQAAIRRWLVLRQSEQPPPVPDDEIPDPSQVWGHFAAHMRLHYPEYLEHLYACHALRSYLLLLGGVLVGCSDDASLVAPPDQRSHRPGGTHESYDPSCARLVDPPLELEGISLIDELEQLTTRFLENKHVLSLIDSEVTGPFLQVLMLVLKLRHPKRFRAFFKHLTKASGLFDPMCEVEAFGETYTISSLLCNSRAAYFLEQLLALATPKQLRRFLAAHVSGREAALASHASANFVFQRCIDLCPLDDTKYLADCAERAAAGWLAPLMRQSGRQQVVVRLLRRCRLLNNTGAPTKAQSDLQSAVFRAAEELISAQTEESAEGCDADAARTPPPCSSLFECLAAIGSGEGEGNWSSNGVFVSGVTGCMLLSELFHYPDTRQLCASLLALPAARLVAACRCPKANRPLEAFLASQSVPDSSKLALYNRLMNSIADLSCDKSGSRITDALWQYGGLALRERVARQLAAGGQATFERLRRDRFGRFAFQRFAPELYARRPDDWRHLQARLDAQQQQQRPGRTQVSNAAAATDSVEQLPAKRPKWQPADPGQPGGGGDKKNFGKRRGGHYKGK